jgi:hypothetical protein
MVMLTYLAADWKKLPLHRRRQQLPRLRFRRQLRHCQLHCPEQR